MLSGLLRVRPWPNGRQAGERTGIRDASIGQLCNVAFVAKNPDGQVGQFNISPALLESIFHSDNSSQTQLDNIGCHIPVVVQSSALKLFSLITVFSVPPWQRLR
jgi:hypothetical protein